MASNSGQPGGNAPPTAPANRLTVAQIMNMTPPLQPGQAPWPQHEINAYRNFYLQRDHPGYPLTGLTIEDCLSMTPPLQPGEPMWSPYELARYRNSYILRHHPTHPLIGVGGIKISDGQQPLPPFPRPQPLPPMSVQQILNLNPPLQPGETVWTPYELARYRNSYLIRDHPGHPLIDVGGISISDDPRDMPQNPYAPPP
ncbi:hypothetical protein MMC22_007161, partial [Lobaria immixta]|nr:hypothetical protein [Lobaria immixta]